MQLSLTLSTNKFLKVVSHCGKQIHMLDGIDLCWSKTRRANMPVPTCLHPQGRILNTRTNIYMYMAMHTKPYLPKSWNNKIYNGDWPSKS